MEKYGFFKSDSGDRIYKTDDFASFFKKLYSNGVFDNGLEVVVDSEMKVIVREGWAMINGFWYYNNSDKLLSLNIGDGLQSRIDNIVVRYTAEDRIIETIVVEGEYSSFPVAPAIVRNSAIYELRLATINVEAGTTELSQSMITDCRFDNNNCGVVINAIQHLDTTDIFAQYQTAFNEWFANIKDQLDDNQAGHLQNEIDTNKTDILTILGLNTDTWSSSSSYAIGDIVIDDNKLYENITGNNSARPSTDTTNWELVPIIVEE